MYKMKKGLLKNKMNNSSNTHLPSLHKDNL